MVGNIFRRLLPRMQPNLRVAAMSNPRQRRIQLPMREYRTCQVHPDNVQRQTLAAVERRRIRGGEGELPADERVSGRKRRVERYP